MAQKLRPGKVDVVGDEELTVTVISAGTKHSWYPGLMTPGDKATVRVQAGMSSMKIMSLLGDDPDEDLIAVVIWMARCQAGETVTLEEVMETRIVDLGFEVSNAPVEADHPLPEGEPSA